MYTKREHQMFRMPDGEDEELDPEATLVFRCSMETLFSLIYTPSGFCSPS